MPPIGNTVFCARGMAPLRVATKDHAPRLCKYGDRNPGVFPFLFIFLFRVPLSPVCSPVSGADAHAGGYAAAAARPVGVGEEAGTARVGGAGHPAAFRAALGDEQVALVLLRRRGHSRQDASLA